MHYRAMPIFFTFLFDLCPDKKEIALISFISLKVYYNNIDIHNNDPDW